MEAVGRVWEAVRGLRVLLLVLLGAEVGVVDLEVVSRAFFSRRSFNALCG